MNWKGCIVLFFVLTFTVLTCPAHAYIDPGTGSYLLQIVIAGFLSVSFFLRNQVKYVIAKIKNIFSRKGS